MNLPGVAPWEWLENGERARWMYRVLDTIAAQRMADKNRGQ